MSDTPPQPEEEDDSYGNVLVLTPTQVAALDADTDARAAWAGLPDNVLVGELGVVVDDSDNVVEYRCAHPWVQPGEDRRHAH